MSIFMNRKLGLKAAATGVAIALQVTPASAQADFNGLWQIQGKTESLKEAGGKEPPLTALGRDQYRKNKQLRQTKDYSFDPTRSGCASPGAVRMMTLQPPIQFFQRPNQLTLLFQWNHLYRLIHLDPKKHETPYPLAIGISNGHWEGPVLVVETTDLMDNTLLDNSGLPHGEQTRVTERFRLVAPDILEDRITISDNKMFTRDWSFTLTYKKLKNRRIVEDTCLDRFEAGKPALDESPG